MAAPVKVPPNVSPNFKVVDPKPEDHKVGDKSALPKATVEHKGIDSTGTEHE